MAHQYGDHITPDLDLPAYTLAHPALPAAVREAREAFEAAQAEALAARDEVDAIEDRAADARHAAAEALRTGKRTPAVVPADVVEVAKRQAESKVRAAVVRTRQAAKAFEDAIVEHRTEVRAVLVEGLADTAAKAAEAAQEARRLYDQTRATIRLAANLDTVAAHRESDPDRRRVLSAVVDDHYATARRSDAITHGDRSARADEAWRITVDLASGIPAEAYAADPLGAPDLAKGAAIVAAAHHGHAPRDPDSIVWNPSLRRYVTASSPLAAYGAQRPQTPPPGAGRLVGM